MKTTYRRSAIIQFGTLIAGAGTIPQLIGNELVVANVLPEYTGVSGQMAKPLTAVSLVGNLFTTSRVYRCSNYYNIR